MIGAFLHHRNRQQIYRKGIRLNSNIANKAPSKNPTISFSEIGSDGIGTVEFRRAALSKGYVLDLIYMDNTGKKTFNQLINENGERDWATKAELNSLQQSFRDGCNAIYNQCVTTGITPSSNSPDAICAAITAISNTAYTNGYNGGYNEGYNAGKNNPASSGTYKISFSGRMHPPGDGSNWINVSDVIYIRVTGSSVVIDTNYISLANGQVDLNVVKV